MTKVVRRPGFKPDRDASEWAGPYRPYDLVKEVTVALIVVSVLVVGLAVLFSSPDDPPVTIKSWSGHDPVDFAQTAITELDGSSGTAQYGPPYNHDTANSQKLGPLSLARLAGTRIPIDTARDFVIAPLETLPNRVDVQDAITTYRSASLSQQQAWTAAYEKAVANATYENGRLVLPRGEYGPVAPMMSALLSMAQSGALDGTLLASKQLYDTDYTKPLLFIADGGYMANLAQTKHLTGDQWGMMNETGDYPGQAWLWLYTLWYQVPPMKTSSNADVEVWAIMAVLTLLLVLLPLIPGLRSIPRWIPVYRLIWRRYYRELAAGPSPSG